MTLSMTLVRSLLLYGDSLNIQASDLLSEVDLKKEDIDNPDAFMTEKVYDVLLARAASLANDPFFGLNLGKVITLQQLGVLGYLVMNSPTFYDALKAYEHFQGSVGDSVEIKLSNTQKIARVSIESFGGVLSGKHKVESFASSIQKCAFDLTGKKLKYSFASFKHPLTLPLSKYVNVLGVTPVQSLENVLEFPAECLKWSSSYSNLDLEKIFQAKLSSRLKKRNVQIFSSKVKRYLIQVITQKKPVTIASTAAVFSMSTRSFQLHLFKEGTSFQKILGEAKAEFATLFIKRGSPSVEIAYALGFSELAAFQRAFKKWTGLTPKQMRDRSA